MRFAKSLVGLAMFTGALMASGAALAVPVINAGGIGVPLGADQISQTDYETLITAVNQSFEGVGQVNSIIGTGGTQGYGSGSAPPPPFLYDEFSGFTVRSIVINPDTSITISLTGGELNYYTFASNQLTNILTQPTADASVSYVKTGNLANPSSLWLALTPKPLDSNLDTVIITIPAGSNLQNIGDSTADAFLDVNTSLLGPASPLFETCTFTDTNAPAADCPAMRVDLSFQGGASNSGLGAPNFAISGVDNVKAFAVPEPLTISLFGAGLVGAAAFGRRKAKKA